MNCVTTAGSSKERAHSLQIIDIKLAERVLREFVAQAWHVIEPATPFVPGWHLDAICDHLQAASSGQIRNLLINMPPRHMKSLAVSVFWPVWQWIGRPSTRWLFASYALSLSIRDSLKCRRLIESPWFQDRWGYKFQLTSDQNAKIRFENDKSGYRLSTSVDSAATGEGGDFISCDDPHNVREAESDAVRESTIAWWREAMSTRGNDPKTVVKVIVAQRCHERDLSGYVLKEEGDLWSHLCLPAEYEGSKTFTSIGWSDPRHDMGELLWPQRFGPSELTSLKRSLGPYGAAGQLQQRPAPAGGGRLKAEWFRKFSARGDSYVLHTPTGDSPYKISECDRIAFMDPAGTDKEQNAKACYTVVQVWDITPDHDMVFVHQFRKQVETPDAADAGVRICYDFNCPWIGVEKNGIGLGVVQTIRRRGISVKPIMAKGSKEARTECAEIRAAAGKVYLPENAPWVFDFIQECQAFPNGQYMDQVDCFAHAAIYVHRRAGGLPESNEQVSRERSIEKATLDSEEQEREENLKSAYTMAASARRGEIDESMVVGFEED